MGWKGDQLGDKLGPRLAQLWLDTTIGARRALAPHEAQVRQAATQAIIDRAGLEVGGLWRPFIDAVKAEAGEGMHPIAADHLDRIASGRHQWEAIAGHMQMASVGAIGSALSNIMFPVTGLINLHDRNLPVDAQTGAQAVAAGLAPYSLGDENAGVWGYRPEAFRYMWELSQTIPPADTLYELVNRGLMSEHEAERWLQRGAIPKELHRQIMQLRKQELSPADAALGLLRGNLTRGTALEIARKAGYDADQLDIIVSNTGEPLGLMQLLEAYRRGIIDKSRLERGIRQSRVRDEWIPVAEQLRYEPMSTADAADAALRGHLDPDQAKRIAELNGLRPGDWDAYFANQGNPPAPEQLLELWRRGKIDTALLRKGIRQGRTRDEWIPQVEQLAYARMTTADAVDAALRGHMAWDTAHNVAHENGLVEGDFQYLRGNAGNPLSLGDLTEAFRRGIIDHERFITGFRESRYRDEWAQTALDLRYSPMSTADAIDAYVQGHLTREQAEKIADLNGLRKQDFGPLELTRGEPLSLTEMSQLYNRGQATRAQFEQALREGRLKDKYIPQAIDLHVHIPEPRQVVQLLEHGAIKEDRAVQLIMEAGYTHEVAAMFAAEGVFASVGEHKRLAEGTIQRAFTSYIIDSGRAKSLLELLHYTAASAEFIIRTWSVARDLRLAESAAAVIRSHYVAHKITANDAAGELDAAGIPAEARNKMLHAWALERKGNVRLLTPAQIVAAFKKGLFVPPAQRNTPEGKQANHDAAHSRLTQQGYDSGDATLLLEGA